MAMTAAQLSKKLDKVTADLKAVMEKYEDVNQRLLALERSAAFTLARVALDKATDALIEVRAMQKSTHQVTAVPALDMKDFEKKISDITGLGKEDFDSDLKREGFSEMNEEDLV